MAATRGISTRREDFAGRTEVKVIHFNTCGYLIHSTLGQPQVLRSERLVRPGYSRSCTGPVQRTIQVIRSFKGTRCLACNQHIYLHKKHLQFIPFQRINHRTQVSQWNFCYTIGRTLFNGLVTFFVMFFISNRMVLSATLPFLMVSKRWEIRRPKDKYIATLAIIITILEILKKHLSTTSCILILSS